MRGRDRRVIQRFEYSVKALGTCPKQGSQLQRAHHPLPTLVPCHDRPPPTHHSSRRLLTTTRKVCTSLEYLVTHRAISDSIALLCTVDSRKPLPLPLWLTHAGAYTSRPSPAHLANAALHFGPRFPTVRPRCLSLKFNARHSLFKRLTGLRTAQNNQQVPKLVSLFETSVLSCME